jgi:DNA-binding MarR family transcriptional regulator
MVELTTTELALTTNTERMLNAVQMLRTVHPQITAAQMALLLAVAARPGRSQNDLAIEVGLTPSAVSRNVDVLGTSGRRDNRGARRMGWLAAVQEPGDDRINRVYLLPGGRRLVAAITGELH